MLAVLYSGGAWKCWPRGHTREEDKNTNNICRKHKKYFGFLLFVQTISIPNIMTTALFAVINRWNAERWNDQIDKNLSQLMSRSKELFCRSSRYRPWFTDIEKPLNKAASYWKLKYLKFDN